jgi:hypothetical protein
MTERLRRDFDCLGIDYNAFYPGETRLQALEILQSVPEANEYQVFFYHSDHLGSSSFITDANGDATQHLQYTCTELVEYVPFGEDLVRSLSGVGRWSLSGVEGHEQNTAAYLSPYTFSGKARDVEMRSILEISLHSDPPVSLQTDPGVSLDTDPPVSLQTDPGVSFDTDPPVSL